MIAGEILVILPELWVAGVALLLLFLDLRWKGEGHRTMGMLAAVGLLPAFFILLLQQGGPAHSALGGMVQVDPLAIFFKGIFLVTAIGVILMTRELADSFERAHGEFYLLILTATLGMLLAASSHNFLMLFVSLELVTISFYVMTAYLKTDVRSLEAGMKYLILGSLASGFFLYGIAFIYGATGSMDFKEIRDFLQQGSHLSPGLLLGLLLVLGGILFKGGGVPFHLWVPDVYEGAPTPVTAFLSVGSKAAGFIVALRIFHGLFLPSQQTWGTLVAFLAGLTILYGNLGAIPQKNIKRLLGYSSIGHAGYLLIGIACGSQLGSAAVNFYLLSYLFTNLAVFLVVTAFSRHIRSDAMRDYAGLSRRSPFLAAAMFLALLSLAGVPPLSGFFGKFLLLLSAVREGFLWLALVGAAAVVISLYYYLLLVKTMYAEAPEDSTPIPVSVPVRVALITCMLGMLGLGIWQDPFLNLSLAATKSLF